jgi:hypothetical protein
MHFRRFCCRRDAVNLFCHAFRDCETWHVASLGASVGISRGVGLERPQNGAKTTTNRTPAGVPLSFEVPALGELFAGQFKRQASAAAEGMPLSVSSKFLVPTRLPACSDAVQDLDSPQHHDNGRYQRSHRQYTL